MQAKWYYYVLLGLVDVEANFLGKSILLRAVLTCICKYIMLLKCFDSYHHLKNASGLEGCFVLFVCHLVYCFTTRFALSFSTPYR